jgi:hypothetical protein
MPQVPSAHPADLQIDGSIAAPYWQCLGLYAMAGRPVTVRLPPGLLSKPGVRLHVGGWKDVLYTKAVWARLPEVVRWFSVTSETTRIASALGGLIYITLPAGLDVGSVTVEVAGDGWHACWPPWCAVPSTSACPQLPQTQPPPNHGICSIWSWGCTAPACTAAACTACTAQHSLHSAACTAAACTAQLAQHSLHSSSLHSSSCSYSRSAGSPIAPGSFTLHSTFPCQIPLHACSPWVE